MRLDLFHMKFVMLNLVPRTSVGGDCDPDTCMHGSKAAYACMMTIVHACTSHLVCTERMITIVANDLLAVSMSIEKVQTKYSFRIGYGFPLVSYMMIPNKIAQMRDTFEKVKIK